MTENYPTSIRLPGDLKKALEDLAAAETRSLNNYILMVLKAHVEASKKRKRS